MDARDDRRHDPARQRPGDAGELVYNEGLADPGTAKTVRLVDGAVTATDGPFAEAKESVIGFWIVDVESEARLLEIAERHREVFGCRRSASRSRAGRRRCDAERDLERCRFEAALRDAAPYALGTLVRRYGQFDACEDAVQEALIAASSSWPADGIPDSPRAWLTTVADRRLTDVWRSESARRRREQAVFEAEPPGETEVSDDDDTLRLIFLCCHPSLSAPSQLALTLRAVGGLTTAEIASAFLVPEATMAQRISRAKQSIRAAGARFELPDDADRSAPARGRAARALPHLQRGLRGALRRLPAALGPHGRGDPHHADAPPTATR